MVANTRIIAAPTRRDCLRSGALVGSGLIAGCANDTGSGGGESNATARNVTAESDGSYSVPMAPMGTVEFESVPEAWMAYFSTYGDMGIALGQLDGLRGLVFTENWPLRFYESFPGLDVSFEDVRQLYAAERIDKEAFYELGCDVHLMDPNFISQLDDSWKPADFEEVATNVGPIIGNSIRRRGDEWHDYPYYTLYEAFEKIARVFDQRERYEAIKRVHDDLLADVGSKLPPRGERPEIGLLSVNSDFETGSFYAYPIGEGNGKKQYRDLGVRDAFADAIPGSYAEFDYETVLEIDPDALVFHFGFSHVSRAAFEAAMEEMRADPVGSRLSAVRNDRLYRGGTAYQGPLINLVQTEIAAKQFYPGAFGEWRGLDGLTEDGWLFDHRQVANVVRGGGQR